MMRFTFCSWSSPAPRGNGGELAPSARWTRKFPVVELLFERLLRGDSWESTLAGRFYDALAGDIVVKRFLLDGPAQAERVVAEEESIASGVGPKPEPGAGAKGADRTAEAKPSEAGALADMSSIEIFEEE